MIENERKSVAVIVAHPDDETLWAGGLILLHPSWDWFIVSLCRGEDTERAQKFRKALKVLKSGGVMGNLDDGPEQHPVQEEEVEKLLADLLPSKHFDLVITHNPDGEYTRHIRHEEISKAVITLWNSGQIDAEVLWTFAYEDGNKRYFPKAVPAANIIVHLSKKIWFKKFKLIKAIYGFEADSWEAQTTPKTESFWRFPNSGSAMAWLQNGGVVV